MTNSEKTPLPNIIPAIRSIMSIIDPDIRLDPNAEDLLSYLIESACETFFSAATSGGAEEINDDMMVQVMMEELPEVLGRHAAGEGTAAVMRLACGITDFQISADGSELFQNVETVTTETTEKRSESRKRVIEEVSPESEESIETSVKKSSPKRSKTRKPAVSKQNVAKRTRVVTTGKRVATATRKRPAASTGKRVAPATSKKVKVVRKTQKKTSLKKTTASRGRKAATTKIQKSLKIQRKTNISSAKNKKSAAKKGRKATTAKATKSNVQAKKKRAISTKTTRKRKHTSEKRTTSRTLKSSSLISSLDFASDIRTVLQVVHKKFKLSKDAEDTISSMLKEICRNIMEEIETEGEINCETIQSVLDTQFPSRLARHAKTEAQKHVLLTTTRLHESNLSVPSDESSEELTTTKKRKVQTVKKKATTTKKSRTTRQTSKVEKITKSSSKVRKVESLSFETSIEDLLPLVHSSADISADAVVYINDFLSMICTRLMDDVRGRVTSDSHRSITTLEINAAVYHTMPSLLSKHAMAAGYRVVSQKTKNED